MEDVSATSNEEDDDQDIANVDLVKICSKMTRKKVFQCEKCSKSFNRKYKLIAHERVHTWKRPYECEICNKRYMRTDALESHKRTHTGEKPYKCEICNNRYSNSASLKYHKMLHTGEKPFECDVCNKKFIQSSQMKNHKRLHTGEKPYECDVCSKRFTQRQNLNKHKRVFNVGRCDICKRKFCFQNLKKMHTKCDKCAQMLKADSNQTVEKTVLKKEDPLNKHILTEHTKHKKLLRNTSVSSESTLNNEITDEAAVRSFDASENKKPIIASIESSIEIVPTVKVPCLILISSKSTSTDKSFDECISNGKEDQVECVECGVKFIDCHSLQMHMDSHSIFAISV